jgi:hypothetical protein
VVAQAFEMAGGVDGDLVQVVRGTHDSPNNGKAYGMPRPVVGWTTGRRVPEA